MSDLSLLCDGCDSPEYDCRCATGGWKGTAITADGETVTGNDHVFWKWNPDKPFLPMSKWSAVPVQGGASEPIVEMYSTPEAASEAAESTP